MDLFINTKNRIQLYLDSKWNTLQLGFKLVKFLDLMSSSDEIFCHDLNSSLNQILKLYLLLTTGTEKGKNLLQIYKL